MRAIILFALPLLLAGPAAQAQAQAQATDGWDMAQTDKGPSASISYEGGQSLILRCFNNRLEALLIGFPVEAASGPRPLTWTQNGQKEGQTWINVPGQSVMAAIRPGRVARLFHQGGDVMIEPFFQNPTEARQPRERLRLPLPSDNSAIDVVRDACGTDPDAARDGLLETEPSFPDPPRLREIWNLAPTPDYPSKAMRLRHGEVIYSCVVVAQGALEDCRIETENPPDAGFGAETLKALRRARLRLRHGVEPGRLTVGRLVFSMR